MASRDQHLLSVRR
ncbi:hypothetical protein LINPERHAP2_LOCUS345 [Linum perenne]